jgi:hypothetical protein
MRSIASLCQINARRSVEELHDQMQAIVAAEHELRAARHQIVRLMGQKVQDHALAQRWPVNVERDALLADY